MARLAWQTDILLFENYLPTIQVSRISVFIGGLKGGLGIYIPLTWIEQLMIILQFRYLMFSSIYCYSSKIASVSSAEYSVRALYL